MNRTLNTILWVMGLLCTVNTAYATVFILESSLQDSTQVMDQRWLTSSKRLGLEAHILDTRTFQKQVNLLTASDVLILSYGQHPAIEEQKDAIARFLSKGGNLYIQSEFQIQLPGNQLFQNLVRQLGGQFTWLGETPYAIAPLNPINDIQHVIHQAQALSYFWHGTYGEGDEYITPILSYKDADYGFLFCPPLEGYGKMLTISDQDWIKDDESPQLMDNILAFLNQNIQPSATITASLTVDNEVVCKGTMATFEANYTNNEAIQAIRWYANGVLQEENTSQELALNIEANTTIFYELDIKEHCYFKTITSPTQRVTLDNTTPNDTLSISTLNTSFCEGESALISAHFSKQAAIYEWYINDKFYTTTTIPQLTLETLTQTSIIACKVQTQNGCDSSELNSNTLELVVNAPNNSPNISLQQSHQVACIGDTLTFEIANLDESLIAQWNWSLNGDILEQTDSVLQIIVERNQSIQVAVKVETNNGCNDLTVQKIDAELITISQPQVALIDQSNSICSKNGGYISIEGTGGQAPYNYFWNTNTIGKTQQYLGAGIYQLTLTDAVGCQAFWETELLEEEIPVELEIETVDLSCTTEYGAAFLHLNTDTPINTITWRDEQQQVLSVNEYSIEQLHAGKYNVEVVNTWGCQTEQQFFIQEANQFSVNLKIDTLVKAGDAVQLQPNIEAQNIHQLTYNWFPAQSLDCANCPSPMAKPTQTTTYTLEVANMQGCLERRSITIQIPNEVYIPNAFSPNNDGKNDSFYLSATSPVTVESVKIFDRWGDCVFQQADIPTQLKPILWDGQSTQQTAMAGVYVFVAHLKYNDGRELIKTGEINLIK